MNETSSEFMSRLDRNSLNRITALQCAVQRAGQDGGIVGDAVDVYALAESNYAWLEGNGDSKKPMKETFRLVDGIKVKKEAEESEGENNG